MGLQTEYKNAHQIDLGIGVEQINEYINEHHKLRSSEIVKYEENPSQRKSSWNFGKLPCPPAKNIENARIEFRSQLCSKDIYYGRQL